MIIVTHTEALLLAQLENYEYIHYSVIHSMTIVICIKII